MPSRARTRHHDAHRFSGGVDESPAFCCWVEPEVEADEAVDGAAAHAAPRPGRGRDNAKAGDDCRALIAAATNGKREVAGTERCRIARFRDRHALRALDPQDRCDYARNISARNHQQGTELSAFVRRVKRR